MLNEETVNYVTGNRGSGDGAVEMGQWSGGGSGGVAVMEWWRWSGGDGVVEWWSGGVVGEMVAME